jgi:PAS domain S-box-containing protein
MLSRITILAFFLVLFFSPEIARGRYLNNVGQEKAFYLYETVREIIPLSNVKVYKRWNEEDIPWQAWFRKGYLPIVIFLLSSFGIIILLFVNTARLRRVVKRNFQDLWEAEENYYRLLEIVNDAVIILDPTGNRIMSVNRQAEKLTGYQRVDLLDMAISSLILNNEDDIVKELFSIIEEEGFAMNVNLNILNSDKKTIKTTVKGRLIKGYAKTIILLTLLECG